MPLTEDLSDRVTLGPADADLGVRETLKRLPSQQARVLTLIHIYGFSHAEVAAMVGTTAGAVKTAAWRAREAFARVYLEGETPDE